MKQEKQLLLKEIKGHMDHFGSFLFISYLAFVANKMNDFRNEVAKSGGNVEVVRKRVLLKAADAAGISLNLQDLPGHICIVFAGKDPVETSKLTFKFTKDNGNVFTVIGGRFEGQMYGAEDVQKLATLPSKDEMRAQFLSTLEAPMSQTLAVMDALLTSVVFCLDNKLKLQ